MGGMATKQQERAAVSDEQLVKLLELMEGSDSVELKATIPASDQRATIAALGLDPLDAQIRQVFFFDTPELALYEAGVVARARRVQGRSGDAIVKLRPVVPKDLPDDLRRSPDFGVEVDAMPGGYVCSATLKGQVTNAVVREAAVGKRPIRKLFSKEQRSFFAAHAPAGVTLDELDVLGPIFVLKLKFSPEDYERKLVAELWLYPDNSRILELSTKCGAREAFQVAAETRGYLARHGVDLDGEQQTKTKSALEFFSRELQASQA
jgi:hypothetical protein